MVSTTIKFMLLLAMSIGSIFSFSQEAEIAIITKAVRHTEDERDAFLELIGYYKIEEDSISMYSNGNRFMMYYDDDTCQVISMLFDYSKNNWRQYNKYMNGYAAGEYIETTDGCVGFLYQTSSFEYIVKRCIFSRKEDYMVIMCIDYGR